MKIATTYKGVTYFASYSDAKAVADAHPGSRIVSYTRGWAVQERVSGPYWNLLTGRFE